MTDDIIYGNGNANVMVKPKSRLNAVADSGPLGKFSQVPFVSVSHRLEDTGDFRIR